MLLRKSPANTMPPMRQLRLQRPPMQVRGVHGGLRQDVAAGDSMLRVGRGSAVDAVQKRLSLLACADRESRKPSRRCNSGEPVHAESMLAGHVARAIMQAAARVGQVEAFAHGGCHSCLVLRHRIQMQIGSIGMHATTC